MVIRIRQPSCRRGANVKPAAIGRLSKPQIIPTVEPDCSRKAAINKAVHRLAGAAAEVLNSGILTDGDPKPVEDVGQPLMGCRLHVSLASNGGIVIAAPPVALGAQPGHRADCSIVAGRRGSTWPAASSSSAPAGRGSAPPGVDGPAVDVGQAEISAGEAIGQPLVVQAQRVQ